MAAAHYHVVKLEDGTFGIRVLYPDGRAETVTGFKDEPAAAAWAALQKYPPKERETIQDVHR